MNLDLHLGPVDASGDDSDPGSGSYSNAIINLEDWLDGPSYRITEAFRLRSHHWRSIQRQVSIPPETRHLALELIGGIELETGEASVTAEERPVEIATTCDNSNCNSENEARGKKEDDKKNNGNEEGLFDCNICLDLAKDPVLTCCGHLFCWPCLYRWLHVQSEAKECPVCKGEVMAKNVTPIYGRGNDTRGPDHDSCHKIPPRPQARQIESWRQTIQRAAFTIPMEEMIRRLGSTFDLSRELVQTESRHSDGPHGLPERSNSLLNRILTSRGMRREQSPSIPSVDVIDLTESGTTDFDVRENRGQPSGLLSRSHSVTLANLASAAERLSAERLVESYFHNNSAERNLEQAPAVDDRDSVSSVAAVVHSESLTVDNAIEINSTVSLSTSSSRRRNNASRISEVDSGDSRAPRRRRIN